MPDDKPHVIPEFVEVYTLNVADPTSMVPSAEEASDWKLMFVRNSQVAPESVEVKTPPLPEAASLVPSADEVTACQLVAGALVGIQVSPEFVEL